MDEAIQHRTKVGFRQSNIWIIKNDYNNQQNILCLMTPKLCIKYISAQLNVTQYQNPRIQKKSCFAHLHVPPEKKMDNTSKFLLA